MNQRTLLIAAATFGMIAVGLGAFGAHALRPMLEASGRMDTFELAVRYQFFHVMALLSTGILAEKFPALKTAGLFFIVGIIIFSGSLFTLALTNQSSWGAVTPIGGVALLAGWLSFLWVLFKNR